MRVTILFVSTAIFISILGDLKKVFLLLSVEYSITFKIIIFLCSLLYFIFAKKQFKKYYSELATLRQLLILTYICMSMIIAPNYFVIDLVQFATVIVFLLGMPKKRNFQILINILLIIT